MGDHSAIEWTQATWNPTTGCTKVSPGCDNCYAIRTGARLQHLPAYEGTVADGDWTGRVNCVPERLDQPLRWKRPRRIFVDSMSDLFHPDVPIDFLAQVWDVMIRTPRHQYQILTKRPQRVASALGPRGIDFYAVERPVPCPQPNIWLGSSIESDRYTWRADHLRETSAAVRFLSLEPLLGPLPSLDLTDIDWVIVGGESGPGARPMHPEWVRDIRDRCVDAKVPFFFKQWGAYRPRPVPARREDSAVPPIPYRPGCPDPYPLGWVEKVGKKAAGRELDGRTWDEMPAVAGGEA